MSIYFDGVHYDCRYKDFDKDKEFSASIIVNYDGQASQAKDFLEGVMNNNNIENDFWRENVVSCALDYDNQYMECGC